MSDSQQEPDKRPADPVETALEQSDASGGGQSLASGTAIGGLFKMIEGAAKAVAAVFGAVAASVFLFYVFGFAIVNLHLLSVGARDFELAKPSYVPAGIAFFVILASSLAAIFLLFVFLSGGTTSLLARLGWGTFCISVGILLAFMLLLVPYQEPLTETLTDACSSRLSLKFFGERLNDCRRLFIVLGVLSALLLGVTIGRSSGSNFLPPRTEAAILVSLPFLTLFLLVAWGSDIYPTLQPALGGGRPLMVRLLVPDAKDRNGLESLGLTFDGRVSRSAGLLDETGDYLLLELLEEEGSGGHDSLRVPREAVRFIQHLSKQSRLEDKLISLLEAKYGDLPAEAIDRVRTMNSHYEVCGVGERVRSAKSLEDLKLVKPEPDSGIPPSDVGGSEPKADPHPTPLTEPVTAVPQPPAGAPDSFEVVQPRIPELGPGFS